MKQKQVSQKRFSSKLVMTLLNRCFIALFIVALTNGAFAQKGMVVRKNIAFAKRANSAVIKGSATWGTAYVYTLRAKAGQQMTITLTGKPNFDFSLVVPPEADGEQPTGETSGVKEWSGTLNDSGVYQIIVSHTIDGVNATPYTLKIVIK